MSEEKTTVAPLTEKQVAEAHANAIGCIEAADQAVRKLLMLVPKDEKTGRPQLTPELARSASRIGDFLSDTRLHLLVVGQSVMGFTEEAREMAIEMMKKKKQNGGEMPAPDPAPNFAPKTETPDAEG